MSEHTPTPGKIIAGHPSIPSPKSYQVWGSEPRCAEATDDALSSLQLIAHCNANGEMVPGIDEANAARIAAAWNAFEDPAGRNIATEDIAPGVVFRLRDALEDLTNRIAQDIAPTATPQMLDSIPSISEARALLSSLKVQEPET